MHSPQYRKWLTVKLFHNLNRLYMLDDDIVLNQIFEI
jgi:hypothetical protein